MPGITLTRGGGGSGTDADAIHDNVAGEIAAIAEKTVLVAADLAIIEDSEAANAKKRVQAVNLPVVSGCAVNISANVSIPNATETAVSWNAEEFDTDAYHSLVSNTDRFTIPVDGTYEIQAAIYFNGTAGTYRRIKFALNVGGTTIHLVSLAPGGGVSCLLAGYKGTFSAGDYVVIKVTQDSGGAEDILQPVSRASIFRKGRS